MFQVQFEAAMRGRASQTQNKNKAKRTNTRHVPVCSETNIRMLFFSFIFVHECINYNAVPKNCLSRFG